MSLLSPYGDSGTPGVSSSTSSTSGRPYVAALRGEHERVDALVAAAVEQGDQALDVLAVVEQRVGHRLADLLLGRDVHDAGDAVLAQRPADQPAVEHAALDEGGRRVDAEASPVDRSSSTTTDAPSCTRARTTCAPM